MQKELKFITSNSSITVIEIGGDYVLKKNHDVKVMINCNRNKAFISDEKAEDIKDRLLGTTNNPLYHLVFVKNGKKLDGKKPLKSIELV